VKCAHGATWVSSKTKNSSTSPVAVSIQNVREDS
jgi:hypothetical protein